METISILGCGWLGLPLAEELQKSYEVKGSYRSRATQQALENSGIEYYPIDLADEEFDEEFFECDVLIIAVPPSLRLQSADVHLKQLQLVNECLNEDTHVIYCNTTAIYDLGENLTEEQASKTSPFAQFEKVFTDNPCTVLRLAGLVDYDRTIVSSLINKKIAIDHREPVNLVHRDDVIQVVSEVIEQEKWDEVYNVCAPEHSNKEEVYGHWALLLGFDELEFVKKDKPMIKTISSDKLIKDLGYSFIFPNPVEFDLDSDEIISDDSSEF
jgi:nucleoside-diphosphate-sugar epimerase